MHYLKKNMAKRFYITINRAHGGFIKDYYLLLKDERTFIAIGNKTDKEPRNKTVYLSVPYISFQMVWWSKHTRLISNMTLIRI